MYASGISIGAQQNIASFQLQQQQKVAQQFQSFAAELQSGGLSTAQTGVWSQPSLPASATSTAGAGDSESGIETDPTHKDHPSRVIMDPGSSSTPSQAIDFSGSPADPSSVQQAYTALGQNLQQLGVSSELTDAQNGSLTPSLSLTI